MSGEGDGSDTSDVSRRDFLRDVGARSGTAVAALALGFGADAVWARAVRGAHLEREDYPRLVVGPYRVHHNVVGYGLVLAGLFRYPHVLVPLGVGMIVGHGLRDRLFWFAERVR